MTLNPAFDDEEFDRFDAVEALAVEAIVVEAEIDTAPIEAIVVDALAVEVAEPRRRPDIEPTVEGERHLRVAPDSVRRRRHVRIAAASAVVTISATLFAVVGFNVELAQHQIQLQKLQTSLQKQQTRYYDLRSEVAERSSPQQIVGKAKAAGLTKAQTTYITAPVPPPPADPTGTTAMQSQIHENAGGSLDPVQ